MGIQRRGHAALATEELIDRHTRALALDVPQRHVDAAQRVVEHRPAAPVRRHVRRLVDVLDVVGVAADEERLEVLLDRGHDRQRPLRKRRAAQPVQSWLARLDLDDDQADAIRRGADRA